MNTYHIARKKPYGAHIFGVRLFRLEGVQISKGFAGRCAIGRIGEKDYDPLAAYYETEERRDGSIPPHLEFAQLSGDDDDAKRFLERFGPLTLEGPISGRDGAHEWLDLTWRESERDTKEGLKKPSEYYRRHLLLEPLTISPKSVEEPELVTVNLGDFWAEQEEFLFLSLLIEAIRSERSVSEARSLLTRVVTRPPEERIEPFVFTPDIYADLQIVFGVKSPPHKEREPYGEILKRSLLQQIKKCSDQEIVSAAARLVQLRVNSRLSTSCPLLLSVVRSDSRSIRNRIEHSWRCRDLVGALYVMLFLDIEHQRRVVRCEGCGVLFQDAKENVLYCSPRCETRTRVRDWWRKHGKNYRAKRRRKLKTARNFKSVSKSTVGRSGSGPKKGEKYK